MSVHGKFIEERHTHVHPCVNYTKADFALLYIEMYGGIDGEHHKNWVLDQVAQILNGSEVVVTMASWEDGYREYRFTIKENNEHKKWIAKLQDGEDGPYTYSYDKGIAP